MSLTLLLVEDDREFRSTLRAALEIEGHRALASASLADARAVLAHAASHDGIDVVLLDLGLPDGDGAALLEEIRRRWNLPIIILSARPGEELKVRLLDAGADDYLVKPFSLAELFARIRVALRHRGTRLLPATRQYRRGPVSIDLDTRLVTKGGEAVHLTPTEYALLARLVRSAGQVVTHRQLLTDVWGADYRDHTHYLRLYMGQLRAKLEAVPADPTLLLTEPGIGYRLAEAEDADEQA